MTEQKKRATEDSNTDADLQQAAALVQAEGNRQLQECNQKIEAILSEYGYELVARVTVQGVVIPVPVTYQSKS